MTAPRWERIDHIPGRHTSWWCAPWLMIVSRDPHVKVWTWVLFDRHIRYEPYGGGAWRYYTSAAGAVRSAKRWLARHCGWTADLEMGGASRGGIARLRAPRETAS